MSITNIFCHATERKKQNKTKRFLVCQLSVLVFQFIVTLRVVVFDML